MCPGQISERGLIEAYIILILAQITLIFQFEFTLSIGEITLLGHIINFDFFFYSIVSDETVMKQLLFIFLGKN